MNGMESDGKLEVSIGLRSVAVRLADISGVTLGALLELPTGACLLLMQEISAETLCELIRFEFPGFNSISQIELPN